MGAAMGQDTAIMARGMRLGHESCKSAGAAKLPPNVTSIAAGVAEAALKAGCDGVGAINTILRAMGVDLQTLRPEPTAEGYTVPRRDIPNPPSCRSPCGWWKKTAPR